MKTPKSPTSRKSKSKSKAGAKTLPARLAPFSFRALLGTPSVVRKAVSSGAGRTDCVTLTITLPLERTHLWSTMKRLGSRVCAVTAEPVPAGNTDPGPMKIAEFGFRAVFGRPRIVSQPLHKGEDPRDCIVAGMTVPVSLTDETWDRFKRLDGFEVMARATPQQEELFS